MSTNKGFLELFNAFFETMGHHMHLILFQFIFLIVIFLFFLLVNYSRLIREIVHDNRAAANKAGINLFHEISYSWIRGVTLKTKTEGNKESPPEKEKAEPSN